MITQERPPSTASGGGDGKPPPRNRDRRREWWREWPAPFNRPAPVNKRTVWRGGLVAVPFLVVVDGLLGTMAWYATGSVLIGVLVFGVTFLFTLGEVALVAWAAKRRQDLERRRLGKTARTTSAASADIQIRAAVRRPPT